MEGYWTEFTTFYMLVRPSGWIVLKYIIVGLIGFGLMRLIYRYATAEVLGKASDSSFILRFFDWLFLKLGWEANPSFINSETKEVRKIGSHPGGIGIDISIFAIIFAVLNLTWPAVLSVAIIFTPLQLCRNRFMRKKIFIAKLEGKKIDA